MVDATARIKNLSIALANLSDSTHKDLCYSIRELIVFETNAYKEKKGYDKVQPAKSTSDYPSGY